MDGSAPFQPWTSAEGDSNAKEEKPSNYDAETSMYENVTTSLAEDRLAGVAAQGPSQNPGADAGAADFADGPRMDGDRIERMQQSVENTLSSESRQQIMQVLSQIDSLRGPERLLLYLKLPTGPPPVDPLKQPLNPLGSRSEIHQTVVWIQTHLEVDPEISLPKQDVYDEYTEYCQSTKMKPLSTADFGKVMKQVYPCVKPRRLGTRGNSRYCYAGMRKKIKLEVPQLPDLGEKQKTIEIPTVQNDLLISASQLIREWAEKLLGIKFVNLCQLAQHLIDKNLVDGNTSAAMMLMSTCTESEGQDVNDAKAQFLQQKAQQRGVIKQLKRKIQGQPQPSPSQLSPGKTCGRTSGKKIKPDSPETPDQSETVPQPAPPPQLPPQMPAGLMVRDHSIKMEGQSLISPSDYAHNYRQPYSDQMLRSKEIPSAPFLKASDLPADPPPPPPAVYVNYNTVDQSRVRPDYGARPRYELPGVYKHVAPPRPLDYQNYKYPEFYGQEPRPHNLSVNNNSYIDSQTSVPNHYLAGATGQLPINLSNTGSNDSSPGKFYKDRSYERPNQSLPLHQNQYDGDSLNLSLVDRRTDCLPPAAPPPPVKISLPGKKMILEAYNNENQINSPQSQSYFGDNRSAAKGHGNPSGEYLPKKMRATESFGGKLAAARLANSPNFQPSREPDRYDRCEPATDASQVYPPANPVLDANSNSEGDSLMRGVDMIISSAYHQPDDFATLSGSLAEDRRPGPVDRAPEVDINMTIVRKNQKNPRLSKKLNSMMMPDNVDSVSPCEAVPPKPATRGRPRKKSLSKAKYTRRQPRGGASARGRCDHSKVPKRSSDSCCSLTDTINIKTGIICAENHSEILNRERVSSICQLDKHALDDYLNEGNSQEHEKELMLYFQQNSDSQSNDDSSKERPPTGDEPPKALHRSGIDPEIVPDALKQTESMVSSAPADTATNLSVIHETSTQGSDFLEMNLDVRESSDEHAQSHNEKLSRIRELLQKNIFPSMNVSLDVDKNSLKRLHTSGMPGNVSQPIDGIGCAFTAVGSRNSSAPMNIPSNYKEGSAAASLSMLSQRRQINSEAHASALSQRTLNARRRVSFETPLADGDFANHDGLPFNNRGPQSVPQSPTSRVQKFNFMPISPGPLSPVNSNKNSPMGATCRRAVSPGGKVNPPRPACGSPVSLSSGASPFVSPRNTPVPRARGACQLKPLPGKLQTKRLSRAVSGKPLSTERPQIPGDTSFCGLLLKNLQEPGSFAVPNEQGAIPRSPGCIAKPRNFPMSAPPSPNILASKYKPSFVNHNQQNGSSGILHSFLRDAQHAHLNYNNNSYDAPTAQTPDSLHSDHSLPSSADPLSHEVSRFFPDGSHLPVEDPGGTLRSQSVPLHQNLVTADSGHVYFDHGRQQETAANLGFLSYNNTPCNSVPPTPVPREFCDFGNLNDTCESISKAGLDSLENLDKIYNVLDSNVPDALGNSTNSMVKRNELMSNLALSNFSQEQCDAGAIMGRAMPPEAELRAMQNGDSASKQVSYGNVFQSEYLKRSNSVEFEMGDASIESRFYVSKSVPSTPLPFRKNLPNFDMSKMHSLEESGQFDSEYDNRNLASKSVPSTPLMSEDRNIFSYSNRDFLINGNSVDPNLSNAFGEKTIQGGLDDSFLNGTGELLEGKADQSALVGLAASPLRETIDMVNTELSFNDDCIDIASELPSFTEQGITSENDLLGALDRIDPVSYDNL